MTEFLNEIVNCGSQCIKDLQRHQNVLCSKAGFFPHVLINNGDDLLCIIPQDYTANLMPRFEIFEQWQGNANYCAAAPSELRVLKSTMYCVVCLSVCLLLRSLFELADPNLIVRKMTT